MKEAKESGVRPIILASTSPRRRALLEQHGYVFEVRAPQNVEEITRGESPAAITLENARMKARSVASACRGERAWVLGVDTEVFFEGRVLGKPCDMADAFRMLSRLNGLIHEVYSGLCLIDAVTGEEKETVDITRVYFHRRSDDELKAYLNRIHPLDKAGAYAAQEDNGELIARFEGSYSNVIGLPMEALARLCSAEL